MRRHERFETAGLLALLLVLWLGFFVHRSPRFAGSLAGGVLAVAGSLLMLVPLAYSIIKRIPPLKRRVAARVSMARLLTLHVYTGLLGPILALLHTGHKFTSPLGIALTAATLLVAFSGYVARYLLPAASKDMAEKKRVLAGLEASLRYLQTSYQTYAAELAARPEQRGIVRAYARPFSRLASRLLGGSDADINVADRIVEVAQAMADVEYAIKTDALFKRLFSWWLMLHVALSVVLYGLLALHIWSALHFGPRWFL